MGDFTPQIAQTAAVALLALIIGAIFRLQRVQTKRERATEERIKELEADLQWCGQHRAILIRACQQAGLSIPGIVWENRTRHEGAREHRVHDE